MLRCLTEFAQDPESQTYINDLDTAAVLERILSLRSDPNIQIPPETTELSPALFNAVLTFLNPRIQIYLIVKDLKPMAVVQRI